MKILSIMIACVILVACDNASEVKTYVVETPSGNQEIKACNAYTEFGSLILDCGYVRRGIYPKDTWSSVRMKNDL